MLLLVTFLLIIIFLMGLNYWEDTTHACREFLGFMMFIAFVFIAWNTIYMLWNHTIEAY